jgi:hypothetical protein
MRNNIREEMVFRKIDEDDATLLRDDATLLLLHDHYVYMDS